MVYNYNHAAHVKRILLLFLLRLIRPTRMQQKKKKKMKYGNKEININYYKSKSYKKAERRNTGLKSVYKTSLLSCY